MRRGSRLLWWASLAVGIVLLAGCNAAHATSSTPASQLPSLTSVRGTRFVTTVDLDDGGLVIDPPGTMRADVSAQAALTMFRAADVVDGSYDFSVMGLGIVTVSGTVPSAPTTTSGGAPGSSGTSTAPVGTAAATTSPSTSGSGTSPGASTGATEPATATTTTAAVPGGVLPAALPTYDDRLAWVGVAWNTCPAGSSPGASAVGPGRSATSSVAPTSTSTLATTGTVTRYTVVVFDAHTGHDALAYTSNGPVTCGGPTQPASVSRPNELVSVPWQPVGTGSTAVQISLPACGSYDGWTDLTTGALQVVAAVPFDPECGTAAATVTVDAVVPLGAAQSTLSHAPLGPVAGERTLPGG